MSTIKQCLYYIFSDVNSVHYICDKDDNIYEGTIEEIMTYDDYIKINIEFYCTLAVAGKSLSRLVA